MTREFSRTQSTELYGTIGGNVGHLPRVAVRIDEDARDCPFHPSSS